MWAIWDKDLDDWLCVEAMGQRAILLYFKRKDAKAVIDFINKTSDDRLQARKVRIVEVKP